MRSVLRFAVAGLSAAALAVVASAQSSLAPVNTVCSAVPSCPSTPVSVPPAWYNLTFSSNPGVTGYGWEATEAGDAASSCGFQHRGIATVNASLSQYVDMNLATGQNSAGLSIPGYIGGPGAGSLAAGTMGWSFEATVRVNPNRGNSKIACIGAGSPLYNIFLSNDGNDNGGLNFGLFDGNTVGPVYSDGHSASLEFTTSYTQYAWYHIVGVTQQVTSSNLMENNATHGAWFIYVNGQLVTFPGGVFQTNILPTQVPRPLAFLGRSDWAGDAFWSGLIDTFRIYNVALTGAQVGQLYAGEMGGCPVPISSAAPTGSVFPNLLPRNTTGAVTPLFSANFTSNPFFTVPGASGYGWLPYVSTDTPSTQAMRTGLLSLSGNAQWVNLALASGPNSIGQVLPTIGGGSAGWTIEIMLQALTGADSWAKVYDLGTTRVNGNPLNDIVLGWDGNAGAPDAFWQFDVASNVSDVGQEWQTGDAIGEAPYNTWMHITAVISAPLQNGYCNYFLYLNGQLYTTVVLAWCPLAVPRQNAYLGHSGWNDPLWTGYIDFFNVYSQALSDNQVAALYAASQVAPPAMSSTGSSGPAPITGRSSLAYQQTSCTAAPSCPSPAVSVPPAWYNLTFSTQPSNATTWSWESADAGDAYCPYQHTGLATFNTSLAQFIDMNAATGGSSAGQALPGYIGGPSAGSISAGTAGWSFETTVRVHPNRANAKIACMGSGAPLYNIFVSQDGTDNAGLNFGLYDGNTVGAVQYKSGHAGIIEYVTPYQQYQWYHLTAVLQQVSTSSLKENNATHGAWFLYVNGQLVTFPGGQSQDNFLPSQVPRPFSYLGRSDWSDPFWSGLIDTFRIYNYALTGAQVTQLYAGEMGGCQVPISSATPTGSVFPNIAGRTGTGTVTPIFSANFSSNPLTTVTGASGYGWSSSLSSDSPATQQLRTGLLLLNASANNYVNFASASGANSVGQVLPTIGGGSAGVDHRGDGAAVLWRRLVGKAVRPRHHPAQRQPCERHRPWLERQRCGPGRLLAVRRRRQCDDGRPGVADSGRHRRADGVQHVAAHHRRHSAARPQRPLQLPDLPQRSAVHHRQSGLLSLGGRSPERLPGPLGLE